MQRVRQSKKELTQVIKSKAKELGFDLIGIAPVETIPETAHFAKWLGSNFQGTMSYMKRQVERRQDPKNIIPEARSMICVAVNYYNQASKNGELAGEISKYAVGKDYHSVILDKLENLCAFINEYADAKTKICVDTSAVLEKLWAQKAGLGWQGKHSNIINRDYNSWLFLGEIITDLELEIDPPHTENHCGTCTSCIDLCPTKAIVAPYVVDSRKCIAYLTIEHKGEIPKKLRLLMGNLIFGCDICQDVCPWNKFAKVSDEAAFMPQGEALTPYLARFADISSDEEFNARFRNSPIKRAKRSGFLRNVAIALGNSKNPQAITPLKKLLNDKESLVRQHSAWAVGQIKISESLNILKERLSLENEPVVKKEIEESIANF
ncbi:tRNA epoxyqueuosine(34) reductase QueG [Candidatus Peregrinibacteria bacterium]|nr:tRNA epoxyqueuosine(34) reductase QueG [Candidatus Peregrinibacteria bacterium]